MRPMAVHRLNDGSYVISAYDQPRPGRYDSRLSAKLAFRVSDKTLERLQDEANEMAGRKDGVISYCKVHRAWVAEKVRTS